MRISERIFNGKYSLLLDFNLALGIFPGMLMDETIFYV